MWRYESYRPRVELAYVAHSKRCALLLDEDGVCQWVVPKVDPSDPLVTHARRCVGAQFVATLDPDVEGLLGHEPRVGRSLLFATLEGGRVTLLRFGPLLALERLDAVRHGELVEAAKSVRDVLSSSDILDPDDDDEPLVPSGFELVLTSERLSSGVLERGSSRHDTASSQFALVQDRPTMELQRKGTTGEVLAFPSVGLQEAPTGRIPSVPVDSLRHDWETAETRVVLPADDSSSEDIDLADSDDWAPALRSSDLGARHVVADADRSERITTRVLPDDFDVDIEVEVEVDEEDEDRTPVTSRGLGACGLRLRSSATRQSGASR
jgi:hypothetical protein